MEINETIARNIIYQLKRFAKIDLPTKLKILEHAYILSTMIFFRLVNRLSQDVIKIQNKRIMYVSFWVFAFIKY